MKVQIIIGSTRPGRVGPQVAKWLQQNLPKSTDAVYEIVDIADWKLPMFDEPMLPMMNQYQHDHTKAWSEKIKEADAFVFLTPEYNAGYPASLKNAIDYLHGEWTAKPVMIVSYGFGAGASASAQLRQVVERLKMRPTKTSPAIAFAGDWKGEDGQFKDIDGSFKPFTPAVREAGEELLELAKTTEAAAA